MSTTPISVTIKTENLVKLDKIRGLVPRSTIINQVLEKYVEKSKGAKN